MSKAVVLGMAMVYQTLVCGVSSAQRGDATLFSAPSLVGMAPRSTPAFDGASLQGSAGWARGAATLAYVSAAVVLAGGIASEDGVSGETGLIIGSVTTAYFAVIAPVVSSGAASARRGGNPGHPGWRMTGWIGYGLTLADAALLIGLGASDVAVPGAPTSVGVLGALSLVAMATDANVSASQASASLPWKPDVRLAWIDGRLVPTVGVSVAF